MGFMFVIYMFLSNNPSSGDINLSNFSCLLLSPYLCFISFLYFDLYVLGDDALIS